MMQALIAGGMDAAWSKERNTLAESHADDRYHPNRAGLFEVPLREYGECNFPLKYQGKLIKVMAWGLDHLAVNPEGYRVVLMRRDPEEIRQSYEGFFQGQKCPPLTEYHERMARAVAMLNNRLDVRRVDVLDYADVIADPNRVFTWLHRNNWQIDPNKAAAVIDPAQYRFRKELLTAGI